MSREVAGENVRRKNGRQRTLEPYRRGVELARRRLSVILAERQKTLEALQALDEEIRLAQGIVELWGRLSNGKAGQNGSRRPDGNGSGLVDYEARRPMRARPLYKALRKVLHDGQPRHLDWIIQALSKRLHRRLPLTTLRSALLRYSDTFGKTGPNEFRGMLVGEQRGNGNGQSPP